MGKKILTELVRECHGHKKHEPVCPVLDNGQEICRYQGEKVHVTIIKSGARGYSIKYQCKLSEKKTAEYLQERNYEWH